jgi:hypothetical protein
MELTLAQTVRQLVTVAGRPSGTLACPWIEECQSLSLTATLAPSHGQVGRVSVIVPDGNSRIITWLGAACRDGTVLSAERAEVRPRTTTMTMKTLMKELSQSSVCPGATRITTSANDPAKLHQIATSASR